MPDGREQGERGEGGGENKRRRRRGKGATERKRITVAVDGKRDLGTEEGEGDGRGLGAIQSMPLTPLSIREGGREGGRPSVVYFGYGPTDRRKKQKQ